MGRITTGTGLMSGIDIQSIVDQLMQLESQGRTRLVRNQREVDSQREAIMDVSSTLESLRQAATTVQTQRQLDYAKASSSNTDLITVHASAGAASGTYQFKAARVVATQQMLSSGWADTDTTTLAAGTLRIESARAALTDNLRLELLNGQEGVRRGSIRITDRGGASAIVDLSTAMTVADVVEAINATTDVSVRADTDGGRIVLSDLTGQSAANLAVTEVGLDHTAEDLGLLGSVAGDTLTGDELVSVGDDTPLAILNNGLGVRADGATDDLDFTLADGTNFSVDLSSATTLGDVVDAINNAADNTGDLVASIDASGDRLKVVDSSVGPGTLSVAAVGESMSAHDLGLLGSDDDGDGTITGSAVMAGLREVLLSRLNGGSGVASGQISITDRDGATSTVDLSAVDTVQDVVDAINGAGIAAQVTASLDASGGGITLTDTSGGTGNLVVADIDATTAADLGLAVDDAVDSVSSGDLNRQMVTRATRLDDLRGGAGVSRGKFTITNSLGQSAQVDLTQGNETTLGDVIDEINSRSVNVTARINDAGDGIVLEDTAGGGELLTVEDTQGAAASDLGIAGTTAEGETTIDGSPEVTIEIEATDTLESLVKKINSSGAALHAGIINDGSTLNPYRLSLTSDRSGADGALLVDTGGIGIGLEEMVRGADAVLSIGDGTLTEPLLLSSGSNTFAEVIDDVVIDINGADPSQAVTVSIERNVDAVMSSLNNVVAGFNESIGKIAKYTDFDAENMQGAILQGNSTLINAQSRLFRVILSDYGDTGSRYQAASSIGLRIGDGGKLSLDSNRFKSAFQDHPEQVKAMLTDTENGLIVRLKDALDTLSEAGTGSLSVQADRFKSQSDMYQDSIEQADELLEMKRERLTRQFIAMERALAQLEKSKSALTSLQQAAASFSGASSRNNG